MPAKYGHVNNIVITGRLEAVPQLTTLKSNVEMCEFVIIVDHPPRKKDDPIKTEYFQITAFEWTAKNISQYGKQGADYTVVCSLQAKPYKDKNGIDKSFLQLIANQILGH